MSLHPLACRQHADFSAHPAALADAHPGARPAAYPAAHRAFSRRQLLSCLALPGYAGLTLLRPGAARAQPPAPLQAAISRPPLMHARDAPQDISPLGWLVSEKLDGVRAWWDGHSLRFRSGRPLPAPAWFTARLPAQQALDGELWLGRGRFDEVSGLLRRSRTEGRFEPTWHQLRYALFDLPGAPGPFVARAGRLHVLARRLAWPALQALPQERLDSRTALQHRLGQVLKAGGEGLMLHRADALWQPGRSGALLKLKPLHDAEAIVVGHQPGRGRHAGRLGALQVRTADGVEFELGTGLTDAERDHPPPAGTVVTYTYRSLTPRGVPRFASFLRVHRP